MTTDSMVPVNEPHTVPVNGAGPTLSPSDMDVLAAACAASAVGPEAAAGLPLAASPVDFAGLQHALGFNGAIGPQHPQPFQQPAVGPITALLADRPVAEPLAPHLRPAGCEYIGLQRDRSTGEWYWQRVVKTKTLTSAQTYATLEEAAVAHDAFMLMKSGLKPQEARERGLNWDLGFTSEPRVGQILYGTPPSCAFKLVRRQLVGAETRRNNKKKGSRTVGSAADIFAQMEATTNPNKRFLDEEDPNDDSVRRSKRRMEMEKERSAFAKPGGVLGSSDVDEMLGAGPSLGALGQVQAASQLSNGAAGAGKDGQSINALVEQLLRAQQSKANPLLDSLQSLQTLQSLGGLGGLAALNPTALLGANQLLAGPMLLLGNPALAAAVGPGGSQTNAFMPYGQSSALGLNPNLGLVQNAFGNPALLAALGAGNGMEPYTPNGDSPVALQQQQQAQLQLTQLMLMAAVQAQAQAQAEAVAPLNGLPAAHPGQENGSVPAPTTDVPSAAEAPTPTPGAEAQA